MYLTQQASKTPFYTVLPNPNQLLPPFIKRNPAFFGVPDSLTTYVGGVPDEQGYMVGGRRVKYRYSRKAQFTSERDSPQSWKNLMTDTEKTKRASRPSLMSTHLFKQKLHQTIESQTWAGNTIPQETTSTAEDKTETK